MGKTNKISQEATNSDSNLFVGGNFDGIANDGLLHNEGIINIGMTSIVEEMGVIAVIFRHVTDNINDCNNYDKSKPPVGWIKTSEKIKINFAAHEVQTIVNYYRYVLPKLKMIEDYFQTLDSENQAELHSHMFGLYNINKMDGMSALANLHKLFEGVIPSSQKRNARYTSMAKALVLFFFEDCTIFEKTPSEFVQLGLW